MASQSPSASGRVAIGELRPDPFNPRKISDAELERLARSIQESGFVDPVIVRTEDMPSSVDTSGRWRPEGWA